jgi:heptosyltransferase-2
LGDAVMTTPALQRLREARPDAHITLLTPFKLADLWKGHPSVDAVIPFAENEGILRVVRRLRGQRFDIALLLPNSPRSALEVFLARIPRRIGCQRPWRNVFLTERIAPPATAVLMRKRSAQEIQQLISSGSAPAARMPATAHQSYHYLHLVAALGASPAPLPPHIAVAPAEVAAVKGRFDFPVGGGSRPILFGLNPGAAYGPAKRWPAERFIAAARELRKRTGCHLWLLGGAADQALAASIKYGIQNANGGTDASVQLLAGRTSLRELCAALQACDAVLTNDSGPMHLAAAVGTPVVALFGSTSPELTSPGLPGDTHHVILKSGVPCAPCFRRDCPIDLRCLIGIEVEPVVQALLAAHRRREAAGDSGTGKSL